MNNKHETLLDKNLVSIHMIKNKKNINSDLVSDLIRETNNEFIWENKKNVKPITMTVALPALKTEKIIWITLMSLVNQRQINFGWELIIWEEYAKSRDVIKSFIGKLPFCQKIIHKNINPDKDGRKSGIFKGKFLLIDKWIGISKQASATSKIFVLQASDCYSSPLRLHIHHTHFKNKNCLFSTQPKGVFFNILNRKQMLYNGYNIDGKLLHRNHLNMAMRTVDMKRIPSVTKNKGIDNYILSHIKELHKKGKNTTGFIFADNTVDSENWKYSIDTDGYNNISMIRKRYYKEVNEQPRYTNKVVGSCFHKNIIDIRSHIPGQVLLYLNDLKEFKKPKFTKIYNNIRVKSIFKHKYIKAAKELVKSKLITQNELNEFVSYVNKVNYLR